MRGSKAADGAGPVSYTHLDVYKRQAVSYALNIPLEYVKAGLKKARVSGRRCV